MNNPTESERVEQAIRSIHMRIDELASLVEGIELADVVRRIEMMEMKIASLDTSVTDRFNAWTERWVSIDPESLARTIEAMKDRQQAMHSDNQSRIARLEAAACSSDDACLGEPSKDYLPDQVDE